MVKSKKLTSEDLGKMIKENSAIIKGVAKSVDSVAKSVDNLAGITKAEFEKTNKHIKAVDHKVEEIKMKFAYTAWQIDVVDLKKRVVAVEKKLGIKSPVI